LNFFRNYPDQKNVYENDNTLIKGAEGAKDRQPDLLRKELVPMVTYDNLFAFVIMLCTVITLALRITNKK